MGGARVSTVLLLRSCIHRKQGSPAAVESLRASLQRSGRLPFQLIPHLLGSVSQAPLLHSHGRGWNLVLIFSNLAPLSFNNHSKHSCSGRALSPPAPRSPLTETLA